MRTEPAATTLVDLETGLGVVLSATESGGTWWLDVPPFEQLTLVVIDRD